MQFTQLQPVKPPDPIVLGTISDATEALGEVFGIPAADIPVHAQAIAAVGKVESQLRADTPHPGNPYQGASQTDRIGEAENIWYLAEIRNRIESGELKVSPQTQQRIERWYQRSQEFMRDGKDTRMDGELGGLWLVMQQANLTRQGNFAPTSPLGQAYNKLVKDYRASWKSKQEMPVTAIYARLEQLRSIGLDPLGGLRGMEVGAALARGADGKIDPFKEAGVLMATQLFPDGVKAYRDDPKAIVGKQGASYLTHNKVNVGANDPISKAFEQLGRQPSYQAHFRAGIAAEAPYTSEPESAFKYAFAGLGGQQFTVGDQVLAYLPGEALEMGEPLASLEREFSPTLADQPESDLIASVTPAPAPAEPVTDTLPAAEPVEVPDVSLPTAPVMQPEEVPAPAQPAQPAPGTKDFARGTHISADGTPVVVNPSIYDSFRRNIGLSTPAPAAPSRPAFTAENPSPVTQSRTPDTQRTQDTFAVFQSADLQQASRDIDAALRNVNDSLYRKAQNQPPVTAQALSPDLVSQFHTDLSLRPITAAPAQPVEVADTLPAAEPVEIPAPPILVIEPEEVPAPAPTPAPGAQDFATGKSVTSQGSPIVANESVYDGFRGNIGLSAPEPAVPSRPAFTALNPSPVTQQTDTFGKEVDRIGTIQDEFAVFHSADSAQASRDMTTRARDFAKSLYQKAQNQPPVAVTAQKLSSDLVRQFQTDLSLRPVASAPAQPVEVADTLPQPAPGPQDFAAGKNVTLAGVPDTSVDPSAWRRIDVAPVQPGVTPSEPALSTLLESADVPIPPTRPDYVNGVPVPKEIAAQFKRNLAPGMRGLDVYALEQQLQTEGYYHGTLDGIYGPQLKQAVGDWQVDHGIEPVLEGDYGYFGPISRAAIRPAERTAPVITPDDSLVSSMVAARQSLDPHAGAFAQPKDFAANAPERLGLAPSFTGAPGTPAVTQPQDAAKVAADAFDTNAARLRTAVSALADSGNRLQAATNVPQAREALTDLALRVAAVDTAMDALAADPSTRGTDTAATLAAARKDLDAGFAGLHKTMDAVFRATGALRGVEQAGIALRAAPSKGTNAARLAALKAAMASLKSSVAASDTALRALGDTGIAGKIVDMKAEVAAMDARTQSFTRLADSLLSLQRAGNSLKGITSVSGDAAQLAALSSRMKSFAAASTNAASELRRTGYTREAALLEARSIDMQRKAASFETVARNLLDMQQAARTMRTASDLDAAGEFLSGFEGTKRILQPAVARIVRDAAAVDRATGSSLAPTARQMQQEVANVDIISALSLQANLERFGASLESQARATLAASKGSLTSTLQGDGAAIQSALSQVAAAESAALSRDLSAHGDTLTQIGRGTGGLAELIRARTQALAAEEGGAAMQDAAVRMLHDVDAAGVRLHDALRKAEREADATRSSALPDAPTVTGAERAARIAAFRADSDALAGAMRSLDTSIGAFASELDASSAFSTEHAKTAPALVEAAGNVMAAWQRVQDAQRALEPALTAQERAALQQSLAGLDTLIISPTADTMPRIVMAENQALSVLKIAVSRNDLDVSERKQQAEALYAQVTSLTDALATGDFGRYAQTQFGIMGDTGVATGMSAPQESLFGRLRDTLISNLGYILSALGVRPNRRTSALDTLAARLKSMSYPSAEQMRDIPAGYSAPHEVMQGLVAISDYLRKPIIVDDFELHSERAATRQALTDEFPLVATWFEENKLRSNAIAPALRGAEIDLLGLEWLELSEADEELVAALLKRGDDLTTRQLAIWSDGSPASLPAKETFIRDELEPYLREVFDLTVRTKFPEIDPVEQAKWLEESQREQDLRDASLPSRR